MRDDTILERHAFLFAISQAGTHYHLLSYFEQANCLPYMPIYAVCEYAGKRPWRNKSDIFKDRNARMLYVSENNCAIYLKGERPKDLIELLENYTFDSAIEKFYIIRAKDSKKDAVVGLELTYTIITEWGIREGDIVRDSRAPIKRLRELNLWDKNKAYIAGRVLKYSNGMYKLMKQEVCCTQQDKDKYLRFNFYCVREYKTKKQAQDEQWIKEENERLSYAGKPSGQKKITVIMLPRIEVLCWEYADLKRCVLAGPPEVAIVKLNDTENLVCGTVHQLLNEPPLEGYVPNRQESEPLLDPCSLPF